MQSAERLMVFLGVVAMCCTVSLNTGQTRTAKKGVPFFFQSFQFAKAARTIRVGDDGLMNR